MKKQNSSLDMAFGNKIPDMFRAIKKCLKDRAETKLKITREQFQLLKAISENGEDVIQKDMADMMGKDKSTILRLIDSLEAKELVRRAIDPKDKRKNYLMVTKKGEKVIKQYMKIYSEFINEIQQGLTEAELKIFYKVVDHFKSKAEKY
ncbi:MAG: MarR family transcriptional regulator [Bacteroidales bacterium]|jgi:MarR family transcriptional regulator for hemolysin